MAIYAIQYKQCVNRYKNGRCNRCETVCPQEAISDLRVSREKCVGCGLCAAVCPARAIESSIPYEDILNRLGRQENIHFSCKRTDDDSEFECLGFLSADLLFAFAQRRAVEIHLEKCASCPLAAGHRLRQAALACNDALPIERRIVIRESENARPAEKRMDRRDFLREITGAAFSFFTQAKKAAQDEQCRPCNLRQSLRRALDGSPPNGSPLFPSRVIGDTCNACLLCVQLCPQQALSATRKKDAVRIQFDPALCGACRICQTHCPVDAVAIKEGGAAGRAAEISLPRCTVCGEIFQPVGAAKTCLNCVEKQAFFK